MLKNKDLHMEIEAIREVAKGLEDPVEKAKLTAMTLQLKLLHNLRTNMVETMRFFKIPLVKSKRHEDSKDTEEKKPEE